MSDGYLWRVHHNKSDAHVVLRAMNVYQAQVEGARLLGCSENEVSVEHPTMCSPRRCQLCEAAFPSIKLRQEHERQRHDGDTRNPAAVAMGRLGGPKGGKARAAKLTPERRSEIARLAANKRWAKP